MNATSKSSPPANVDSIPASAQVDDLLDRALDMGAFPASTSQLLQLTRRDEADLGPVVDALALNPGLAAAVLRVANSAVYGQARSIADLTRAVTVIGMQELHDIVAATAMMSAFSRPNPLSQRIQSMAVLSGAIAVKLSQKLKVGSPSSAYLSGLMCELGALACLALDPEFSTLYVANDLDARSRFDGEVNRYGGTTALIGGRILSASALPQEVSHAVGMTGLEPESESEDKNTFGRVVAFSRLASVVLLNANEHGSAERLRDELVEAAGTVKLDQIDPDVLMQICLAAASDAELSLRGELTLAQLAPSNDIAPPSKHVAPAEAPAETPAEMPAEMPAVTPAEMPAVTPAATPKQTPPAASLPAVIHYDNTGLYVLMALAVSVLVALAWFLAT